MLLNLLWAIVLLAGTFLIHASGVVALTGMVDRTCGGDQGTVMQRSAALLVLVLGLFLLLMAEISLWAGAFALLGVLPDFETALYFSTSTFATVGFGDIAPAHEWRLLAAIEGLAGFLIIGWSGAVLVVVGSRCGPFQRGVHF